MKNNVTILGFKKGTKISTLVYLFCKNKEEIKSNKLWIKENGYQLIPFTKLI